MISLFNFPFIQLKYAPEEMTSIKLEAGAFLSKYKSESPQGWRSSSKGTFKDPYMNIMAHGDNVSSIKKAINVLVSNAANQMNLNPMDFQIADSWINQYEKCDSQEVHSHVPFSMSGIFYISAPEGATITFYNPCRNSIVSPTPYDAPLIDLPVEEGLFLFFPSYLDHSVPVHRETQSNRITLALNTIYAPSQR